MLLADVNVLLYAHREESPQHAAHKQWLVEALSGSEPFGVSEAVLASCVRLATNHRVYRHPSPPSEALGFCEDVLASPVAVRVRAGERHWELFTGLCQTVGARGNVVPDAFLAALAIEHGATLVTHDRGFARFPGLRWQLPPVS